MTRPSSHIAVIVYSLVMLAALGGATPCLGRTRLEVPTSPREQNLEILPKEPRTVIEEAFLEEETERKVQIEAPQRYNPTENAREMFSQHGIVQKMPHAGNLIAQWNDDQKTEFLRQKNNVNDLSVLQFDKEQILLEMSSLVDSVTEADSKRGSNLGSWLLQWISSIFGGNKPGDAQDQDNEATTPDGRTSVTGTSEAIEDTSEWATTAEVGVTGNSEDTSDWIVTTDEVTSTTSTTVPTTTEDHMAEYCSNACKAGTAGLECGCPEHPIG